MTIMIKNRNRMLERLIQAEKLKDPKNISILYFKGHAPIINSWDE
jgi:hypothetical protein